MSRAADAAMYPSVGKVDASTRISSRPSPARRAAATTALKTFTLVESPTTICPAAAPTSGAIRSPIRSGAVHQPLSSQDLMRSWPHWRARTSCTRAGTWTGSAPSELPSR
ncbi:hypothetical protein QFZ71_003110 [Streptomyces sp. V2I9]|nr:hypothetical protein [Streptomyces sp. V2I9]